MIDDETPAATSDDTPTNDAAPAALKFNAPGDTTAMHFSTGRSFAVDEGVLSVPDDLTVTEQATLRAYGFTPA